MSEKQGLPVVDVRDARIAKLEALVAELREEIDALHSRIAYQEHRRSSR